MFIQQDNKTCGEICVRNLISKIYKGDRYGALELKYDCSTFLGMVKSLKPYGIQSSGYIVKEFDKLINDKYQYPFIAQLEKDGAFHFVLVLKMNKRFLKVSFPERGVCYLSYKKYKSYFTNKILLVEKVEKTELKEIQVVKKKEKISIYLLAFLQAVACLVMLYLFSIPSFQLFSLLILPFIFVLGLCQKSVNLSFVNRFDKEISSAYLKDNHLKGDLESVTNLRNSFIKDINDKAIFMALICLGIGAFFVIPLNQIALILVTLISCELIYIFFHKYYLKVNSDLYFNESKLLEGENFDEKMYLETSKKACTMAKYLELQKILVFVMVASFVLFSQIIDGSINPLSLLTQTVFYYYLAGILDKSTDFLKNKSNPYTGFVSMKGDIYHAQKLYKDLK